MAPAVTAAVCCAALIFGAPAYSGDAKLKPVIRQVDHILIQTGDPISLFSFLSETLQLPVAWPISEYSGFVSGGVGAGNVTIEVLRLAGHKDTPSTRRSAARFMGIALEPYHLEDCLQELRVRGIPYHPPETYVSTLPDGSRGPLWTNTALPQLSRPGLSIFLCEYSSAYLHAEIRRNQLGGQLALRNGGPLGVKSVKEIVIGTRNPAESGRSWRELLSLSGPSSTPVFRAGNGPAIRLAPDTADRVRGIVLEVGSIKTAREFLAEKHWLGPACKTGIAIEPSRIQGLSIHLVEK